MPYSLEGSHYVQPTLKEWWAIYRILEDEYLHKLFWILVHERFVSSPSFIYLCNHLLVSVETHGYLSYTSGCNATQCYFIVQIIPALAIGHYFGLTFKSFWHTLIIFFNTSLFSGTMRCSRLILYIFLADSYNQPFLKEFHFVFMENYIGNQDLDFRYACCYCGTLGHLSWQSKIH